MFDEELAFANTLADEAERIAMSFFRGSFEVRTKADRTPVTEADLAIESMIREQVRVRFPDDGILGEEEGSEGASARRWIVDPIDGTRNFAAGIQIWATLIAFSVDGAPVVGVAHAPALGERYEAARGGGARLNGETIRVSTIDRIDEAAILHGGESAWIDGAHGAALLAMVRDCRRDRGFGDFWGHVLVARGSAEVMFEPELSTWDWAALQVVVEEAGGRMTQFDGAPPAHGGSVVTTNGGLHDEILGRLGGGP